MQVILILSDSLHSERLQRKMGGTIYKFEGPNQLYKHTMSSALHCFKHDIANLYLLSKLIEPSYECAIHNTYAHKDLYQIVEISPAYFSISHVKRDSDLGSLISLYINHLVQAKKDSSENVLVGNDLNILLVELEDKHFMDVTQTISRQHVKVIDIKEEEHIDIIRGRSSGNMVIILKSSELVDLFMKTIISPLLFFNDHGATSVLCYLFKSI